MRASWVVRRSLAWAAAALAALIVLGAGLAAVIDAGYCRGLLVRYFSARIGRPIQVDGALQAHIFSRNPRIVAERVSIGNPPWMPSGLTAEVGKASVVFKLPRLGHPPGIVSLDMQSATLNLVRDSSGRANWQLTDPSKPSVDENSPIVRNLSMLHAHVVLDDALRHLKFDGTVSAQDLDGPGTPEPLRVEGSGQLNGKAVSFEVTGDPLPAASHRIPYRFRFTERSSGSRIDGEGALPQPFRFDILDATFKAAGSDLKDLYFLTGVSLIDTGDYLLSGKLSRRESHTEFSDLAATSARSDVHGAVSIDSSGARPRVDLDLNSHLLRLSDLGARAAGHDSAPGSPLLLSDATLNPQVLRVGAAAVKFRAHEVDVGHLQLHEVSAKATVENGVLTVTPLLAELLGGKLDAHLVLDARKDIPSADVDIKVADLQLGQFAHKEPDHPPIEGLIRARVQVTGVGRSVHQIAASANGTVTAQMPNGEIRQAFAELTGVDLRGLGLLLAKNKREIPIRCAIAKFKAQAGTLIAQSLIADTDPVLITGEGQIHLDSEAVDLVIRGHPKSVRLLRLRAPVAVRGTLAHPAIDIQGSKSTLVLVDAGKAGNADCPALIAEAGSVDAQAQAPR